MHTLHPSLLDQPLAISYRNHQKSLAYFIHVEPLVILFYYKVESKREGTCGAAANFYILGGLNILNVIFWGGLKHLPKFFSDFLFLLLLKLFTRSDSR